MIPSGLGITLNLAAGCVKPGQACEHDLDSVSGWACEREKSHKGTGFVVVDQGDGGTFAAAKTNDAQTDGTRHRQCVQFGFLVTPNRPRKWQMFAGHDGFGIANQRLSLGHVATISLAQSINPNGELMKLKCSRPQGGGVTQREWQTWGGVDEDQAEFKWLLW